jgi:predicted  nucleic acid-binding Zn-ribbon protein
LAIIGKINNLISQYNQLKIELEKANNDLLSKKKANENIIKENKTIENDTTTLKNINNNLQSTISSVTTKYYNNLNNENIMLKTNLEKKKTLKPINSKYNCLSFVFFLLLP